MNPECASRLGIHQTHRLYILYRADAGIRSESIRSYRGYSEDIMIRPRCSIGNSGILCGFPIHHVVRQRGDFQESNVIYRQRIHRVYGDIFILTYRLPDLQGIRRHKKFRDPT